MLWASASVAGKYGLRSVEPLMLYNIRFLLAGLLLVALTYGFQRNRLPTREEWRQLAIFGLFNTALYLGFFILALQSVAAGITTLAIVLNPLFITLLSSIWSRRKITASTAISIVLGSLGVVIAAYPLLNTSYATLGGLALLAISMLAYSFGAVYYSRVTWHLPRLVVNGWQTLLSSAMLLPITFLLHESENHFNTNFWLSEGWLVVMVSVFAVQLWLRLLKTDVVGASLWLYLCPIFGFFYATLLLNEPFTLYTLAGAATVLTALYIGQRASAVR